LVALLAITALAIDGGVIYSDRRYSQSAADASSLAGGGVAASTMDDLGVIYTEFTCTNSGVATACQCRGCSHQPGGIQQLPHPGWGHCRPARCGDTLCERWCEF